MISITTEEAETLARQLDANEPMVQDPVALEFFADVATALRSLATERDQLRQQYQHDRGTVRAAVNAAEKAEAEAEKLRSVITGVIVAYEYDIAQGVEPSDDRRRVIAVLRAALNQGGDDGREKAKRHHHDGIPDGLLMRGD